MKGKKGGAAKMLNKCAQNSRSAATKAMSGLPTGGGNRMHDINSGMIVPKGAAPGNNGLWGPFRTGRGPTS